MDQYAIDTINIDFDRSTGENINGWDAVSQNIRECLLTDFGNRVMREYFGSLVPRALGRNMTVDNLAALSMSIGAVLEVFEPRFKVTKVYPENLTRLGALQIRIEGEYRPRALIGDETGSGLQRVTVQMAGGNVEVL